jgi:uncharacterized protein YuzE
MGFPCRVYMNKNDLKEIIRDVIKDELKIFIDTDGEVIGVNILLGNETIASDAVRIDGNFM